MTQRPTHFGRESAADALALRPAYRGHRALGDARALETCVSLYHKDGSRPIEK